MFSSYPIPGTIHILTCRPDIEVRSLYMLECDRNGLISILFRSSMTHHRRDFLANVQILFNDVVRRRRFLWSYTAPSACFCLQACSISSLAAFLCSRREPGPWEMIIPFSHPLPYIPSSFSLFRTSRPMSLPTFLPRHMPQESEGVWAPDYRPRYTSPTHHIHKTLKKGERSLQGLRPLPDIQLHFTRLHHLEV